MMEAKGIKHDGVMEVLFRFLETCLFQTEQAEVVMDMRTGRTVMDGEFKMTLRFGHSSLQEVNRAEVAMGFMIRSERQGLLEVDFCRIVSFSKGK